MNNLGLVVGCLYRITLQDGTKMRALLLGFRPYYADGEIYLLDMDTHKLYHLNMSDLLSVYKLDTSIIKDEEIYNKLKSLQARFPSIVENEKELSKKLQIARKKYEDLQQRYTEVGIGDFYKLEDESSILAFDIVNSGFKLSSQEKCTSLSVEEFRDMIVKYMNPTIKDVLFSSPCFKVKFERCLNQEDGCMYTFSICREKVLSNTDRIVHNSSIYYTLLEGESNKESISLKYLNCNLFKPYEHSNFYGYRADIYSQCKRKVGKDGKVTPKIKNIYISCLMRREFEPFPLTESNAKKIAESIFIDKGC